MNVWQLFGKEVAQLHLTAGGCKYLPQLPLVFLSQSWIKQYAHKASPWPPPGTLLQSRSSVFRVREKTRQYVIAKD